jgi:hypothetical protein
MHTKRHTKEAKLKMRENHKDYSGENNPMHGRSHSEGSKEAISKSKAGKIWIWHPVILKRRSVSLEEFESWEMTGWKRGRGKF